MKKIILLFALIGSFVVQAQRSVCGYSTCVPGIPFTNTDLMQIYGALVSTSCCSSGGATSVIVTNTVPVQVVNTLTVINTVTVAGNVGGYTAKPQVTLTADGTIASGKNIGGILTFTATRSAQRSGLINDITIFDPFNAKASLIIDIWNASPSGTFTSGSAQVISASSASLYIGSIVVGSGDYLTTGSMARANITGLGLAFYSAAGGVLYFTVQTSADVTFGVNETLTFSYGILQD